MNDLSTLERKLLASIAELKQLIAGQITTNTAPWLNTDEACRMLRCSASKLSRLRNTGAIKHTGQGTKGATVLHSRKSIEMYLERQANKHKLVK